MANNRLYLRDKESGQMICLGKHLAGAWYAAPTVELMQEFYDFIGYAEDLELVMEDAENAPSCRPEQDLAKGEYLASFDWQGRNRAIN